MPHALTRAVVNAHAERDQAWYVVAHALRQLARGKQPSATYYRYRNPRVALAIALRDLGFMQAPTAVALAAAARAMGIKPVITPNWRLNLPKARSKALPFDLPLAPVSLEVVSPRKPQRLYPQMELAGKRPIYASVVVRDAEGSRLNMRLRLNHDLAPTSGNRVLMRGKVAGHRAHRLRFVRLQDGGSYRIRDGDPIQLQLSPDEGIYLLEFFSG